MTVAFIVEQLAGAGTVSARKMFGEYTLYCDGKVVGLVCNDELFVKPTAAGRAYLGDGNVSERAPYEGAKPCFVISGDRWEDRDWLGELIRLSAAELPIPAARRRQRS